MQASLLQQLHRIQPQTHPNAGETDRVPQWGMVVGGVCKRLYLTCFLHHPSAHIASLPGGQGTVVGSNQILPTLGAERILNLAMVSLGWIVLTFVVALHSVYLLFQDSASKAASRKKHLCFRRHILTRIQNHVKKERYFFTGNEIQKMNSGY